MKLAILTRILTRDRICIWTGVRILTLTLIRILHLIPTRFLTRVSRSVQEARASIIRLDDARMRLAIK